MTQQKARTHEESMDRHFDSGDGAGRRYGEHICGWARPRAFCRNRYLQWHRRLAIWTRIGAASARPAGPTGPTAAPAGMAGSDRTAEKEEGADSVLRAVRSLLFNESIVNRCVKFIKQISRLVRSHGCNVYRWEPTCCKMAWVVGLLIFSIPGVRSIKSRYGLKPTCFITWVTSWGAYFPAFFWSSVSPK